MKEERVKVSSRLEVMKDHNLENIRLSDEMLC